MLCPRSIDPPRKRGPKLNNHKSLSYSPPDVKWCRFAYDGLDRIAEFDGSNALLRRYVHAPAMDEPIVWYEGSGTTDRRFLSADERGSIVSVTNSSGTLLGINRYDEFGQPQGTNLGVWGYTGQAWLPSIGVWYYKTRVYDPELGRFLQPDPIEYGAGPNLYAYVLHDPVNLTDPLGLDGDVVVTGFGWCIEHPASCMGTADVQDLLRRSQRLNQVGREPGAGGNRQRTRKIGTCVQRFLASKSLYAPNVPAIRFVEGNTASGVEAAAVRIAFNLHFPAITIKNTIYVAPGHWRDFRPGTPEYFEEIIHSIQYRSSGTGNFISTYFRNAFLAGLFTGDMHNNPAEIQAMAISQRLAIEYKNFASKMCR